MGREGAAHILVVDDDPAITRTLGRLLAYEGYTVSTAADGSAALRLARDTPPSAVILDVMLPDASGMEVCGRLRESGGPPVLFLTARDGVGDRVRGLDSGGDDYLSKPFAAAELLARLRALLRRSPAPSRPLPLTYADLSLDLASRSAQRAGRPVALSTTEYELLEMFLRHPHQILTRDQLLASVWGDGFTAESNVLEVYVRYLRVKLEKDGAPRLIHTVRGTGYVLRAQS
jgi:two-component system response regulator MprA